MTEQKENQNDVEEFSDHPDVVSLNNRLSGMSKDLMKKATDRIRTDTSHLSSIIDQLKKKREEHNSQARHYRNMRDNASGDKYVEIDQYRKEANSEKELRDKCNEQIRLNKELREELKGKLREAWDRVKDLRDKYYQMKNEVGILPEDITKEIRDLEWKQQ
ncbi:MAG: hypothetical protein ACTSSH_06485, partial [Candidatus Heimdallarchaeota archaeon]